MVAKSRGGRARIAGELLLSSLRGNRGSAGGSGLGVEVHPRCHRCEGLVERVDEWDAGGDIEFRNLVIRDVVEVLHEGAK